MVCCNEFIDYGCFSLCDETISNPLVVATDAGIYTLQAVSFLSYSNVQTFEAEALEVLTWQNTFAVGYTNIQITDPDGELIGCYTVKITRPVDTCPELTEPTKELSPC